MQAAIRALVGFGVWNWFHGRNGACWEATERGAGRKKRSLCPRRIDQWRDPQEVHDPRRVIGQNMRGHFGGRARHPNLLSEISRECPNSVRISASRCPVTRYACLIHVFDFVKHPGCAAIARYGDNSVFAGADSAHRPIEQRYLVDVQQTEAQDGDLIFCFGEGRFEHVGFWHLNGRVVSKWDLS